MQGIPATDLSSSLIQYSCGSLDLVLKKTSSPLSRSCHKHIVGKPCQDPSAAPSKPTSQRPQVPPKPRHIQALRQDKQQQQIPPAPCRPLPIPPPKPKTLTSKQQKHPAKSVCLLIEKFENSRAPILGVQTKSALRLHLRMEAPEITEQPQFSESEGNDPGNIALKKDMELPSLDFLHIACIHDSGSQDNLDQECHSGDLDINHSDSDDTHNNTEHTVKDRDHSSIDTGHDGSLIGGPCEGQVNNVTEANGKIPNRDSGIDSPSCGAEGEAFSNEVPIEEEDRNDSIATETESVSCITTSNKRDSTQDEDSDLDEGSSEEPESLEVKCSQSESQKLFNIAQELLHTEEAYVKRLNLLDQVFCTKLTAAGIPTDVINGIFSNISSIYCFHNQFLLPELQTRITQEWNTNPRIGDILQKLAPFMKMYGEYVKNFDPAMDLVNTWTQRSTQFKSVVQNIQKQDVCGNLTLQHHMLEPVQRIPRYELLLKDYLKKLPSDAPDRRDAEKALDLISTAANHSNAAIKKMEKMNKLLEVYERLGGEIEEIVNPANELIKEGHIKKMSAKNGTAQDRYLYLFNNMLLYCVPKLRLMGQKFSVREKIDIAGMEVQENIKQNLAHAFAIIGKQRSLELQARNAEEKQEWIQVILATIDKQKQKSETFNKAFSSSLSREEEHIPDSPSLFSSASVDSDGGVNERRSSKKREKEKETCKGCNENFNFTKRKHHCKNCSAAVCGKCSKVSETKNIRVCKQCYEVLHGADGTPGGSVEQKKKSPVEKQLSFVDDSYVLCSQLMVQEKGKTWTKTWVAITKAEPLTLHLQTSSQDVHRARTISLPAYEVSTMLTPSEKAEGKHVFRLSHSQHALLFSAPDVELMDKWVELLSHAAKGEALETSTSVTEHRKSR
ncbi:hypothetical protein KOW79_004061 [Hemibagrus wyckioides]|uniref:FYVE, RhoGEF and PH domain-containing protein 3 n=2 Tax=Hemibagrus wyckioides TaxID=337641 RepID=A0A9D3SPZ5_9TELE|nr:hypothetical protein KOW79_004061 [Hemibagrus wyckioides]